MIHHNSSLSHFIIKVASILILLLFIIFPVASINNNGSTDHSSRINLASIEDFNASRFIDDMVVSLEDNAIYENNILLGWIRPYFQDQNPDPYIYNGYQTGIAGIGDFLLDAYSVGHSNALPLLLKITDRLIQNYTVDPTGGIYWQKYANYNSEGWLGERYGNTGIVRFLARAQKEGLINDTDHIIAQSYLWVKKHQFEDGRWPYDEVEKRSTTDLEYGASGIAYSFAQSYRYLGNTSYLNDAISITDWILEKGIYEGDIFYIPWSLYDDESGFEGLRYTGVGTGSAGLIKLMLDMYELTNDVDYYDALIGLSNDLLARDLGGFWPQSSLRYITNLIGHTGLTGYLAGASGIADILHQVYELTKDPKYLESSIRSEKFIEGLITENGTVGMGLQREDRFYTGQTLGSSGVAKFFINLYENYYQTRHALHATSILKHLHEVLLQYGMMPVEENELRNGFSWTVDNGLAGIGHVVIEFIKADVSNQATSNPTDNSLIDLYLTIYSNVTPSSSIPSTDGSSDSDDGDFPTFVAVSGFLIILVLSIRSLRKYQK